jgi:hypothetical protein
MKTRVGGALESVQHCARKPRQTEDTDSIKDITINLLCYSARSRAENAHDSQTK